MQKGSPKVMLFGSQIDASAPNYRLFVQFWEFWTDAKKQLKNPKNRTEVRPRGSKSAQALFPEFRSLGQPARDQKVDRKRVES